MALHRVVKVARRSEETFEYFQEAIHDLEGQVDLDLGPTFKTYWPLKVKAERYFETSGLGYATTAKSLINLF
jgi:hypothetical protein